MFAQRSSQSNPSPFASPPGSPERVLLLVVGRSPAVLTETVWALAHEVPASLPDRVIVLTTSVGKAALDHALFEQPGWENLLAALRADGTLPAGKGIRFGPTADAVRLLPSADGKHNLSDIRSHADSEAIAETFAETIRAFAENPDVHITASIAGGRKTMGALLHAVLTLHGRSTDRITHVLVSDPWDRLPAFLFPGCPGAFRHPETGEALDSASAEITLSDVPFIPLRYLFEREIKQNAGSFQRLVRQLRERVTDFDSTLALHLDGNPDQPLLTIGERPLALSPLHFAVFLYFAYRAARDQGPLRSLSDLDLSHLQDLAASYATSREERMGHWSHVLLERHPASWAHDTEPRRLLSEIRRKLRDHGFDSLQIDHLLPHRGNLETALRPEHIRISPPKTQP
jgi:CRISPR-associated protein (TIGR02584 family)